MSAKTFTRGHTALRRLVFATMIIAVIGLGEQALAARVGELDNQSISDAVEDEIRNDFLVTLNSVDVMTDNGVVTLTGKVGNLLAKERATRIAETVKGVRAVVNRIEVDPYVDREPEQIESAVSRALVTSSATDDYEITVTARDGGIVVLSGIVQSLAQKNLAELVAKSIAGVTAIDNEITVASKRDRSDEEIEQAVKRRLQWNMLVEDGLIGVDVEDGVVRLRGTVGSAAERREARRTAEISGVKFVDTSALMVERWARDDDLRSAQNLTITDEEIAAAIDDALLEDPRVEAGGIEIQVINNVAILRGRVDDLQSMRAAEQDARNTVGVIGVKNRIKVRPRQVLSDEIIEKHVHDALLRDAVTESRQINVRVVDGVARLTGDVDNYFEKSRAEEVAASVKGVRAVENLLVVADAGAPYTYDPYYDPWPPYSYDWYDYQPRYSSKSDKELREAIKNELWWSPFVDSDDITVFVDQGIATLAGIVDTPAERRAARENALDAGATWVVNKLEIRSSSI